MVRISTSTTLASAALLLLITTTSTAMAKMIPGLPQAKTCRNPNSDCCNFQNSRNQTGDAWHEDTKGWFWDSMITKPGVQSTHEHDSPKAPIVALTFNPTETWTDTQKGRFWGPGGVARKAKRQAADDNDLYRRLRVQVPGATRDITLNCQDPDSFQCYDLGSLGAPFKHLNKPLEIHPGNYCKRMLGTDKTVWDNLWVRYDGVMKDAPRNCKPWHLPTYDAPFDQIWAMMCFFG